MIDGEVERGEECGEVDYAALCDSLAGLVVSGDLSSENVELSDAKIRQLVERVKGLEGSNARLRRRVAGVRSNEAKILEHSEQLMLQMNRMQETLAAQQIRAQKKDPLRLRLAGPVENFANRTGEKWPAFKKERRRPFPGVGQAVGASTDALKQILSQVFDSVSDACDYFNTSLAESMSRAEVCACVNVCVQFLSCKNLLMFAGKNWSISIQLPFTTCAWRLTVLCHRCAAASSA